MFTRLAKVDDNNYQIIMDLTTEEVHAITSKGSLEDKHIDEIAGAAKDIQDLWL
jgi:hypothetical protein